MYVRTCPTCQTRVQAARRSVGRCASCGEAILFNGKAESASSRPKPMSEDQDNRRAYERYLTAGRVLVRPIINAKSSPAPYRVGQLENLSGGGAYVVSEHMPGVGEPVEIMLAVSDHSLMRLQGRIKHRRTAGGEVAAGVEFCGIDMPARHRITATARLMAHHKQVS